MSTTNKQSKDMYAIRWTKVCYYYTSFEDYLKQVYGLTDEQILELYPDEENSDD